MRLIFAVTLSALTTLLNRKKLNEEKQIPNSCLAQCFLHHTSYLSVPKYSPFLFISTLASPEDTQPAQFNILILLPFPYC